MGEDSRESADHILWFCAKCPILNESIYSLLAAGLALSVGWAGGVGRGADASADQVAPAGCVERLRSPGDRTSRPAEVDVTGALTIRGAYRTVDNFSLSVGVEGRWRLLTLGRKRIRPKGRRRARSPAYAKTCQLVGAPGRSVRRIGPDLPASSGWARVERRLGRGRGPRGRCFCGSGRTRRMR